MGLLRFWTTDKNMPERTALARSHMVGLEGAPWVGRCDEEEGGFSYLRRVDDSGCLAIPLSIKGIGERMLTTATLVERDKPYPLFVELARGMVNLARGQLADWSSIKFTPSEEVEQLLRESTDHFIKATLLNARLDPTAEDFQQQAEVAEGEAIESLRLSLALAEVAAVEYSRFAHQRQQESKTHVTAFYGVRILPNSLSGNHTEMLTAACNMASLPIAWRRIDQGTSKGYDWRETDQRIQFCRTNGLRILGGPLMQLDTFNLPDWIYLWEDDFETFYSYLCAFVEGAVRRYRGIVNIWNCAARMNTPDGLNLSESRKLELTVDMISRVRHIDSRTPLIVSFNQPWGDYMASRSFDLSPIYFADYLIRADQGVAGVGLEINVGDHPGGTRRDLLALNRMIDRWACLGAPLLVFLSYPGTVERSDEQKDFIHRTFSLLKAKSAVRGVFWNQWSDVGDAEFADAGLIDSEATIKPAMQQWVELFQRSEQG